MSQITKKHKISVALFIGASLLFLTFTFYSYQILLSPNVLPGREDRYLQIPTGTEYKDLLEVLRTEYLAEPLSFAFLAKLAGYNEKVIPGRYLVTSGMSNYELVRLLASGRQSPVKLTFNNVRTKEQLAGKIGNYIETDSAALLQKLNSAEFCAPYGLDTANIIGLFVPDTYEVYWNISPEKLMEKMQARYRKLWTEERKKKAEALGLSPAEVTVLASIVQAESLKKDERPVIAGVYLNRLRTNMKLQADPTVIFALRNFEIRRLREAQLIYDSPYNTYRYAGLPPGPINSPEAGAIDAVLNYQSHKFIYFCAKEDFSGFHNFAETFEEHKINANKYRDALNKNGYE